MNAEDSLRLSARLVTQRNIEVRNWDGKIAQYQTMIIPTLRILDRDLPWPSVLSPHDSPRIC